MENPILIPVEDGNACIKLTELPQDWRKLTHILSSQIRNASNLTVIENLLQVSLLNYPNINFTNF